MFFLNSGQAKRFFKSQGRNLLILLVFLVFLVVVRVALPYAVKWYVNRTLNEIPEYSGHVEDISISLWRGGYVIREITIEKKTGKTHVPFLKSEKIDLSLEWMALLQGSFVGKVKCYSPVINFVNGPTSESTQVGVDQPWFDIIKKLFPLAINRCEVENGSIHYRDFSSSPKVNLKLDRIYLLAHNLTNSEKLSQSLVAKIKMEGRAFEESSFFLKANVNPWTEKATFNLTFKLDPVSLTKLNDFSYAYGKFDFAAGTLAITSELAAKDGMLVGYIKPLFDHVAILQTKDLKNPLTFAWKGMVGGFLRLFRNLPKDRFATKIPIYGTFSCPKGAIVSTLGNILKNQFIRAYTSDIEHIVY